MKEQLTAEPKTQEKSTTKRSIGRKLAIGTYVLGITGSLSSFGFFINEAVTVPDFSQGSRLEDFAGKVKDIKNDFSNDDKFVDTSVDLSKKSSELRIRDSVEFAQTQKILDELNELRQKRDQLVKDSDEFYQALDKNPDVEKSRDLGSKDHDYKNFALFSGEFALFWTAIGGLILSATKRR